MFSIRREQGRLDEVRPVVEAVARLNRESATWRPGLAALYAELGLLDAAGALLDDVAADDLASVPHDALRWGSLSYLADAAVAVGHRAAAEQVYRELRPFSGYAILVSGLACYGAADRYLGRLAELCGRSAAAIDHLEAALRFDEAIGAATWTAHSQLALGQFLARRRRRSDEERSAELLTAALTTASTCGLAAVAERCTAALAELEPSAVDTSATLTARELMVLRLVAEGATNRQIGASLNLSRAHGGQPPALDPHEDRHGQPHRGGHARRPAGPTGMSRRSGRGGRAGRRR